MLKIYLFAVCTAVGFGCTTPVLAESTVKESMKETGRDIKKEAKKAGRNMKDETCEMVNGKMKCLKDKAVHKIENGADEVKDKADDLKH